MQLTKNAVSAVNSGFVSIKFNVTSMLTPQGFLPLGPLLLVLVF
jgi:hypothetical protein